MKRNTNPLSLIVLIAIVMSWSSLMLTSCAKQNGGEYFRYEGKIFGTTFNIQYQATENLNTVVDEVLQKIDNSLSTFNQQSTLARINSGETEQADEYLVEVYKIAHRVSELSSGGFDITVAPLVNAWGFGVDYAQNFKDIDEDMMNIIGYEKLTLTDDGRILKAFPQMRIDCSAIAKGYACDKIAQALRDNGVKNLLVEVGGEVVFEGTRSNGKTWQVGINTPKDDPMGMNTEIEDIVTGKKVAIATSGSYRQFYEENGKRYSHTIDPHTGYPVSHNLLSATVIAPTGAEADALATACMVLGVKDAMEMINKLPNTEGYFIVSDENSTKEVMTEGMKKYLVR